MDLVTAINLLNTVGVIGALSIAIIGGKRGWYLWKDSHDKILAAAVAGYTSNIKALEDGHAANVKSMEEGHSASVRAMEYGYKTNVEILTKENGEIREDRDYWREHAVQALLAAQKAVTLADRVSN